MMATVVQLMAGSRSQGGRIVRWVDEAAAAGSRGAGSRRFSRGGPARTGRRAKGGWVYLAAGGIAEESELPLRRDAANAPLSDSFVAGSELAAQALDLFPNVLHTAW
jgi:hypothetical protein